MPQVKRSPLHFIVGALGILTLIPLSVDGALAFDLSGYTVRLNYLSFMILALFLLPALLNSRERRVLFDRRGDRLWLLGLGLLALAGTLGTLHSENQRRSLLFLVWTLGTLATLPITSWLLWKIWNPWVHRVFAIYLLGMSLILISDGLTCYLPGHPTIGRVILTVDYAGCRPFGFYQEPNYFAAFALLASFAVFLAIANEANSRWRALFKLTMTVAYLAIFFSTSKMGMAAVAALSLIHGTSWLKKRRTKKTKLLVACSSAAIIVILAAGVAMNGFLIHSLKSVTQIAKLSGTDYRKKNAKVVFELLERHPLVGVGPSGAGAYVFKHSESMPRAREFLSLKTPSTLPLMSNDPFFYNLYSEVLGEWGAIGFLGLCLVLLGLYTSLRGVPLLVFGASFAAVSLSWQTLPRFDLWTCLSLAWLALQRLSRTEK